MTQAVKTRLAELGWTQRKLSEESGVDAGTISKYLKGERNPLPTTVARLEQAMGWPVGHLHHVSAGPAPLVRRLDANESAVHALFVSHGARTNAEKIDILTELLRQVARDEMRRTR